MRHRKLRTCSRNNVVRTRIRYAVSSRGRLSQTGVPGRNGFTFPLVANFDVLHNANTHSGAGITSRRRIGANIDRDSRPPVPPLRNARPHSWTCEQDPQSLPTKMAVPSLTERGKPPKASDLNGFVQTLLVLHPPEHPCNWVPAGLRPEHPYADDPSNFAKAPPIRHHHLFV